MALVKRVSHDCLGHRLQPAAASPLQHPAKQQDRQRRSDTAGKAGDREDGDAKEKEVLAANQVRGPSAQGKDDRVGDQVAGKHPRTFICAGAKIAGDMRQGYVRDRGVEHFHERCQRYGHGDQPRIHARLPPRVIARRVVRIFDRPVTRGRSGVRFDWPAFAIGIGNRFAARQNSSSAPHASPLPGPG